MDKIILFDKSFKKYIPFEEFSKDIDRIAAQLNSEFKKSNEIPILLCTMSGALPFTAELMMRLDFECELSSIKLSSYDGTVSTGEVVIKQPLCSNVEGRTVIIIEDIVDKGHTMDFLKKHLAEKGASDIRICTLFHKPESFLYKGKFALDYCGREIQNLFIVGFGLDYNELGRNYRDIYILDE